jgi:hypothetical protein
MSKSYGDTRYTVYTMPANRHCVETQAFVDYERAVAHYDFQCRRHPTNWLFRIFASRSESWDVTPKRRPKRREKRSDRPLPLEQAPVQEPVPEAVSGRRSKKKRKRNEE